MTEIKKYKPTAAAKLYSHSNPRAPKFNEERQQTFLEGLAETGRYSCAAVKAGINVKTTARYRADYPDFEEACADAIEVYNAWMYDMVRERIAAGSDRILELELKRIDPAYRDKPLIDVNVGQGGGVIMGIPAKDPEVLQLELKANNAKRLDPTIDPDMEIDG